MAVRLSDILVVNAGSSSLKLRRLAGVDVTDAVDLDAPGGIYDAGELTAALDGMDEVAAVGHRVVHGGEHLTEPVRITADVIESLRELCALAPLHQPPALAAIEAVGLARPGTPAVACFDTAFHSTLPAAARTYALPAEWRLRWPLRRYGFHGLSHAWASRRAAEQCGHPSGFRVVTCHLGAGASLAAVLDGRSIDTTMGFTPLAGLVMGSRAGDVDPGLVLWLLRAAGLTAEEVADGLERAGGLVGLAGTADVAALLRRDDDDAVLALEVYVHSLCRHVAAMASSLGGLDALVFTGGVGEHAAPVRAAAARGLAWLGVGIDDARNASGLPDSELTADGASVRTFVVSAREDLEIARGVRRALSSKIE